MGPSEPRITPCEATYPPLIAKRRRQVRKLDVMMVPVDDDDDFIVQPPGEGEDDSKNGVQAGPGASLLEGFKRLVFAKGQPEDAENKEPDPTLPPGFSAILNAEEEEIYPANVRVENERSLTYGV